MGCNWPRPGRPVLQNGCKRPRASKGPEWLEQFWGTECPRPSNELKRPRVRFNHSKHSSTWLSFWYVQSELNKKFMLKPHLIHVVHLSHKVVALLHQGRHPYRQATFMGAGRVAKVDRPSHDIHGFGPFQNKSTFGGFTSITDRVRSDGFWPSGFRRARIAIWFR